MNSRTHTSPFLALPLEIRLQIYEQLLSPDPQRVYTLYHDRHGRALPKGSIDPNILQVNQQIHSEAVPILYENNKYLIYLATPVITQCTGGNYRDRMVDPADLFRADTNDLVEIADGADVSSSQSPIERSKAGIIYPHCFKRLRQINLVTACHAIWDDDEEGDYHFTHIGRTIWKILKILEEDQAMGMPLTKHLKATFEKGKYEDIYSEKLLKPVLCLLKALQRRTGVEIEVVEETFTRHEECEDGGCLG